MGTQTGLVVLSVKIGIMSGNLEDCKSSGSQVVSANIM